MFHKTKRSQPQRNFIYIHVLSSAYFALISSLLDVRPYNLAPNTKPQMHNRRIQFEIAQLRGLQAPTEAKSFFPYYFLPFFAQHTRRLMVRVRCRINIESTAKSCTARCKNIPIVSEKVVRVNPGTSGKCLSHTHSRFCLFIQFQIFTVCLFAFLKAREFYQCFKSIVWCRGFFFSR